MRRWARRRRPVVLEGAAAADAPARWSLDALAAAHGGARVRVARTRGGRVWIDPGRGLVFGETTLAAYAASLRAGACDGDGYLIMRLEELPAALRRDVPEPPYGARAGWRVSKLWVSAAGTTSALHYDLADNVHVVLSGRKRFLLVPPEQRRCVYPRGLLSSVPNGALVDPEAPDLRRFPRYADARPLWAEVGPGEAIFIPHGFWHHVRSLEPTVAVNTWWAEGPRRLLVGVADAFKRLRGISR
jgi:mannose-6-phosphate isomerase-like protein (cupin superfamily)